jgi:hypothetical protein
VLQQKLRGNVAASRTILAFRRDDMSFRLNRIELSGARYVRVSIVQMRPGYEEEFVGAMYSHARLFEMNEVDRPWMVYEVHSGLPILTFIEFHPMDSLREIDDFLDRTKKGRHPALESKALPAQKWMGEAVLSFDVEMYTVNLSISHVQPAAGAANLPAQKRNGRARDVGIQITHDDIPIVSGRESNGRDSNQTKD